MKMIINKLMHHWAPLALALFLLLGACGKREKEVTAGEQARLDSLNNLDNVQIVAAIAKVEPTDGFIELSTDVSGIVAELFKKEGDSVSEGEIMLGLGAENESPEPTAARPDILTQPSSIAAAEADVKQYEASLREEEEDLAIASRLAATGAATRQNVSIKQKERDAILSN